MLRKLFRRSNVLLSTQDDVERLFENPTYGASTEEQQDRQAEQQPPFPRVTYAIYDAVTTPSQRETHSGETYNVLHRGKEGGKQCTDFIFYYENKASGHNAWYQEAQCDRKDVHHNTVYETYTCTTCRSPAHIINLFTSPCLPVCKHHG